MAKLLSTILSLLDKKPAVDLGYDDLYRFDQGELAALESAKIIVKTGTATSARCYQCGYPHDCEVEYLPNGRAFIDCPDSPRIYLSQERLQKWTASLGALCAEVGRMLDIGSQYQSIKGLIHRVGRGVVGGDLRTVFIVCGANDPRNRRTYLQKEIKDNLSDAIVFSLSQPIDSSVFAKTAAALSLHDFLVVDRNAVRLDSASLARALRSRVSESLRIPDPPTQMPAVATAVSKFDTRTPTQTDSNSSSSKPLNVFKRNGEYWIVGLGGEIATVKNSVGMSYVRILLDNPGQWIESTKLIELAGQSRKQKEHNRSDGGISVSTLEASELQLQDTAEYLGHRVLGEDYDKALREALDAALKKLETAKKFRTAREVVMAQDEVDALYKMMRSDVKIGGRSRIFSTHETRARSSVKVAIDRVESRLDGAHPKLALYIRSHIQTGLSCIYLPDEKIFWTLD